MAPTSPGGRMLLRLRRQQGRTQADLGAAAGVSVRTIRGLERGEILSPQVATLQQLSLSLGLPPQLQAEFLRAWSLGEKARLRELIDSPHTPEVERIDALARAHLGGFRTIHQAAHAFVDECRHIHRSSYEFSIQSVVDGLEEAVNVVHGDQASRAAAMRMVGRAGCVPGRRWNFPGSNAAVQMVRFPRPLARGERHSYGYEILSEHSDDLAASDGFTRAVLNTVRCLVVTVQFAVPPATLRHIVLRPGNGHELLESCTLDADHRAVLVLEDEQPTGHGFSWSW